MPTGSAVTGTPLTGVTSQLYWVLSLVVKLRITNVELFLMFTLDVRLAGSLGFVFTDPSLSFSTKGVYLPAFKYLIVTYVILSWS